MDSADNPEASLVHPRTATSGFVTSVTGRFCEPRDDQPRIAPGLVLSQGHRVAIVRPCTSLEPVHTTDGDRGMSFWKHLLLAALLIVPATRPAQADDRSDLDQLFLAWEQASASRVAPSIDQLHQRNQASHSAHELHFAHEVLGPIDRPFLLSGWNWTIVDQEGARQRLRAEPRDDLEKLFYSAAILTLDENLQVTDLHFEGESGNKRVALVRSALLQVAQAPPRLMPVEDSTRGDIQLVAFETTQTTDNATAEVMDVDELLARWTAAGEAVKTLEGTFRRFEYDAASSVETWAQGRIVFSAPFDGLYLVQPVAQPPRQGSRRSPDGTPYQIAAPRAEALHWNDTSFTRLNLARREYERFVVPEDFLQELPPAPVGSWDVIWTTLASPRRLLPGLLERDAEALQERFDWSIVSQDANQYVLSGRTLKPEERRHYSSVQVVLDRETLHTRAIKTIDSTGTRETVHVFDSMRWNPTLDPATWTPNLSRCREMTIPPAAPPVFDE